MRRAKTKRMAAAFAGAFCFAAKLTTTAYASGDVEIGRASCRERV